MPDTATAPVRPLAQMPRDRYSALSPKLETEFPISSRRTRPRACWPSRRVGEAVAIGDHHLVNLLAEIGKLIVSQVCAAGRGAARRQYSA